MMVFIFLFLRLFIYLFIWLFVFLFIHSFIYLFVYLFIYSFVYFSFLLDLFFLLYKKFMIKNIHIFICLVGFDSFLFLFFSFSFSFVFHCLFSSSFIVVLSTFVLLFIQCTSIKNLKRWEW